VYLFRNKANFLRKVLLAPRLTPKVEDHTLSAVRDFLFNIFAATLHTGGRSFPPKPENSPCHGDRDPLIVASVDAVRYNDLSRIQSVFWLPVEGLGKIFLASVWLPQP
jgi:hypothetical protein